MDRVGLYVEDGGHGRQLQLYLHGRSGGVCMSSWREVESVADAEAELWEWSRRWSIASGVLWRDGVRVRGWSGESE